VLTLGAADTWRGKPSERWTQEEALDVLNDSPWARTIEIYQPSGRRLGIYQTGQRVVVQDSPTSPPRIYQPPPFRTELEYLRAVYAVRWDSAGLVQQALERLNQHSTAVAETQAPPPELPADSFVLTARVVQPPAESDLDRLNRIAVRDEDGRVMEQPSAVAPDLFAGLTPEELRDAATLRVSKKAVVNAERALRFGLGTGEGISFFFPRQRDGQPTIPATADSVEFQFRAKDGLTLKARFKLKEMQASGKPDY
jgi:hypothetical protein